MPTNTTHRYPDLDPPSGPSAMNIASNSPACAAVSSSITPVGSGASGGSAPVLVPESGFGIDRVSFTIEPDRVHNDPSLWNESKRRSRSSQKWARNRNTTVKVGGAKVHLSIYRIGGIDQVRFDFNPSRVFDPDGVGLCPAEHLPAIVQFVVAACSRYVEISPERLAYARLTRLDVAVDFPAVLSPVAWILGLTRPTVTYARTRTVYISRSGQAESYYVGSKSAGQVIVYDKHQADPDLAPEGYLRFEVQARTPWLKKANITTLAEITPTSIHCLARDRFEWMMGRGPLAPLPPSTGPLPLVDLALDFATGTEILKEAS